MHYNSTQIRDAYITDAKDLINLIRYCFQFNYLIYSVYQSEKSLRHLENIVRNQSRENYKEFFRVLVTKEGVLGFYNAKSFEDCLFLNYIVTRQGFGGKNIGSLLLNDFHDFGQKKGFMQFQLDVYGSNAVAYNWYMKNGYKELNSSYNHCFKRFETNGPIDINNLISQSDQLNKKLKEEYLSGFSKVKFDYKQQSFEIMLIDGRVLRFQNLLNITEDELLDLAFNSELKEREYFLFTGRQQYQGSKNVLFSEKVVRMIKIIQ